MEEDPDLKHKANMAKIRIIRLTISSLVILIKKEISKEEGKDNNPTTTSKTTIIVQIIKIIEMITSKIRSIIKKIK